MKVLSLFDGISCGRLALERAGIPVEKYYSSEIDKYAITVADITRRMDFWCFKHPTIQSNRQRLDS